MSFKGFLSLSRLNRRGSFQGEWETISCH